MNKHITMTQNDNNTYEITTYDNSTLTYETDTILKIIQTVKSLET